MKTPKYTATTKRNRAIPSLLSFALLVALVITAGHTLAELKKKDDEHARREWRDIERTLADERLIEFIRGRSQMVDERDLQLGTPALVYLAQEIID